MIGFKQFKQNQIASIVIIYQLIIVNMLDGVH
jgi:hypothetical protein